MIQNKLFNEIRNKNIFTLAKDYGLEYLETVFERNVFPDKTALKNLSKFDEPLSDGFTSSGEILKKLNEFGAPASVAQVGGRYFGFVDGGVVPAGLSSRLLSDFWDQNTAMYAMSPIASKLETVVQKWLRELFRLPETMVAGFVSGSSMATFCGLAAARYRILQRNEWDINQKGLYGAPRVRIVTGNQAHSTVIKAVTLLGMGKGNIEFAETDSQGRIIPEKIPPLDSNTILILQAGNVNTGSFDDFKTICEKAVSARPWIHIDGAFGLPCRAVNELKHLTSGMEMADSWSFDGHKTLNTPYDNGIILCNDEEALTASLRMSGPYIGQNENRDGILYTPEMSRRARIIELWATLKSLGKIGIGEMIYGMHLRAKQFAKELEDADFEILNEIHFNQVLVHYRDNETTLKILKKVQELGICWCGSSKWGGKDVIRISVCSWATTEKDITLSAGSFIKARELLLA